MAIKAALRKRSCNSSKENITCPGKHGHIVSHGPSLTTSSSSNTLGRKVLLDLGTRKDFMQIDSPISQRARPSAGYHEQRKM